MNRGPGIYDYNKGSSIHVIKFRKEKRKKARVKKCIKKKKNSVQKFPKFGRRHKPVYSRG